MRPNHDLGRRPVPRVAFFTDSFHEANGVALTSRQFAVFARSRYFPFLSVHAGPRTGHVKRGSFETYELEHSRMRLQLEHDLAFDLRFWRHLPPLARAVTAFRPDLVHVTGPGHIGILGVLIAHRLGVPLVASWHTNVHEFGARRLRKVASFLPERLRDSLAGFAERRALEVALRFYKLARMHFAPNPESLEMLARCTGRPGHLMRRGVDTELFSPARRVVAAAPFTIGYVGRLSAEKNVRLLAALESEIARHIPSYRFLIVGQGSERTWLRDHLANAELPGLLRGEELAAAYASMDVFVFPSETDTFGNVILEAMASGVPAIVSAQGGPKYLVKPGVTGFVAGNLQQYASAAVALYRDPSLQARVREAARSSALQRSWSGVFEAVYEQYKNALAGGVPGATPASSPTAEVARARVSPVSAASQTTR